MATQLIKHLKTCADNDSIYKPLEAQWAFDERLIAKALQTVGNYFPHYSRHDESHSRQILVHIERLLGDNIAQLSATDTWLLLEAAYLHDIGMVISDEHLTKDFDEIKQHVEKNRHTATGDSLKLMNALLASKEKTASAVFANVDIHPFQATKLLREIIADFYRVKHPERADFIINTPLDIGLESPRNELLPRRFFSLLGKICGHHGKPFAEVMKLPKQQVGVGTDECHPRFVACLLRLGDLLDLDDNRFCPVMLKMAGELPSLSKAHHEKHLAIRHFRADRERIEIEADCPSYESYIETNKWFGWLREEVKNQMSQWFDIVPSREFGLLPSVGDLKAHLQNWQVFNDNERPHFTLDRDRIFELLQGAGLYESKEQALRELLQNAVDATLIRVWREHGEDCIPMPDNAIHRNDAPRADNVRDILKNYPIEVSIDKENEDEQHNYWRITISDQGTGISRDDLTYMMQMGSSKKNAKKRAIIDTMPIWMRPSGIFGIGLHSVFLLSDEVIIETRSIDTGENLVIRFTNPTNAEEHGNVYFQIISEPRKIKLGDTEKEREFKPWNFARYGTQLSFIVNGSRQSLHKNVINAFVNHDGLIKDNLEDEFFINLSGYVFDFFKFSFISGELKYKGEAKKLKPEFKNKPYHYDSNRYIELIDIDFFVSDSIFYHTKFFYRGQRIKRSYEYSFSDLITVSFNLLNNDADEILTINRNGFKDNKENRANLEKDVIEIFQNFFETECGENFYKELSNENKTKLSAEYKLLNLSQPRYFSSDWMEFLIEIAVGVEFMNKFIKINELKNYEYILFFGVNVEKDNIEYANRINIVFEKTKHKDTIFIENNWRKRQNKILANEYLKEQGYNARYIIENDIEIVEISKNKTDSVTDDMLKNYCEMTLLGDEKIDDFLKRRTIPLFENYKALTLKEDNMLPILDKENLGHQIQASFSLDLISPRMLFPLAKIGDIGDKITVGNLDILAKRVYKNRADESVTEQQIKDKYEEFISFIDGLMKDNPEWVKLRGNEFNPA